MSKMKITKFDCFEDMNGLGAQPGVYIQIYEFINFFFLQLKIHIIGTIQTCMRRHQCWYIDDPITVDSWILSNTLCSYVCMIYG